MRRHGSGHGFSASTPTPSNLISLQATRPSPPPRWSGFTARNPGRQASSTWWRRPYARVTLNGVALDPAEVFDGERITLPDLRADNELRVVRRRAPTSRTGEGLHRFVDPVDGNVYLYSQFETADAHRMYACFDQPDLKATFTLTVLAPADWKVVSNSRARCGRASRCTAARRCAGTSRRPRGCRPTSPRWSPARTTWCGTSTTASTLGLYCRASLAQYLDADAIFEVTKQGFDFFHRVFGYRVPVRQVRPAVRAGVQRRGDGERRVRSRSWRTTSSARGSPRPATSAAPRRSCTRWRTCGSATWSPCAGGTTCG